MRWLSCHQCLHLCSGLQLQDSVLWCLVVCDTEYGSIGHVCSHVSPAHDQTGAHTVQGFTHPHCLRSSLSHQLSTSPAWQAAGRWGSRSCSLPAFCFPATGTCWSPGHPSVCECVSESRTLTLLGGYTPLDAGPANCHSHPMSPSQHCWVLLVPGTGEAASTTGSWGGLWSEPRWCPQDLPKNKASGLGWCLDSRTVAQARQVSGAGAT